MAVRFTQTPVEVGVDVDPTIRTTQTVLEVGVDTDPSIRTTQTVLEVGVATSPTVRTTQTVIEVGVSIATSVRVTSAVLEAALPPNPATFVTQAVLEIALPFGPSLRTTQAVLEAALFDQELVSVEGEISQLPTEFMDGDTAGTRVDNIAVEYFIQPEADTKISSEVGEVQGDQAALTRITQEIVEIMFHRIIPPVPICPPGWTTETGSAVPACPAPDPSVGSEAEVCATEPFD